MFEKIPYENKLQHEALKSHIYTQHGITIYLYIRTLREKITSRSFFIHLLSPSTDGTDLRLPRKAHLRIK